MSEQLADGQQPSGATQDGDLKDPLSARNTDTGNMKRVAVETPANQVRKTIKLKPLSAKKEEEAPAAEAAPSAAEAAAASAIGEQATVAMEKMAMEEPTQKLQKSIVTPVVPVAAPAPSSFSGASSVGLPGAKQTIKLRPSTSSASHADSAPIEQRPASAQTIKLTPKSAPSAPPAEAAAPAPAPAPAPAGGATGVSEPSLQSIKEVQTVAMARQTIRLVPKKVEVPSSAPVQPKPSDPTINLQNTTVQPKPSEPAVQLAPAQLAPKQDKDIETSTQGVSPVAADATKPRIGLKGHASAAPAPAAAQPAKQSAAAQSRGEEKPRQSVEESVEASIDQLIDETVKAKDEPNIFFSIAAVLALLTIGYLSFALCAQYVNHWQDGSMGVPPLTTLVGK